jgi:hypothetical protein
MGDHKRRLNRLEDEAGGGDQRIYVCWCMRDQDVCTCPASKAIGENDVIITVEYEEPNERPQKAD